MCCSGGYLRNVKTVLLCSSGGGPRAAQVLGICGEEGGGVGFRSMFKLVC